MTLLDSLSSREREIAERISAGMMNSEIASDLYVSVDTIKSHVRTLYQKLGVRNRVEVVLRVFTDPDLEPLRPPPRDWGKASSPVRTVDAPAMRRKPRPRSRPQKQPAAPTSGSVPSAAGRLRCDGCQTEFLAPHGAVRIPGAAGTVSYYADGVLVHACEV